MQNEIDYLNQLLVSCPSIAGDINLAIAFTEAKEYDALKTAFTGYNTNTACRTNLMACVDRILLGVKA